MCYIDHLHFEPYYFSHSIPFLLLISCFCFRIRYPLLFLSAYVLSYTFILSLQSMCFIYCLFYYYPSVCPSNFLCLCYVMLVSTYFGIICFVPLRFLVWRQCFTSHVSVYIEITWLHRLIWVNTSASLPTLQNWFCRCFSFDA